MMTLWRLEGIFNAYLGGLGASLCMSLDSLKSKQKLVKLHDEYLHFLFLSDSCLYMVHLGLVPFFVVVVKNGIKGG